MGFDLMIMERIELSSIIGVNDWERRTSKKLTLDLTLAVNTVTAAQTDDLSDTLDYAGVVDKVVQFAAECEFQLLEALAGGIADMVLEQYDLPWVRLKLAKPGVMAGVSQVALVIERTHPAAESFSRAHLPL
jgi:dihydroneopterin aldolase